MADAKELEHIDERSKLNTDGDNAKIKFQHSTNGEAKVDMPDTGALGFQCGLTKEELMKYANDPFWIVVRRVLLVLFWLLWIAMLAGAVAIIIMTPGCPAPKTPDWYESSPMYELRVDKFADKQAGVAPLKAVNQKTSYFKEIFISTVVLDKLFTASAAEKMRIIDPDVGSFDDFTNLTKQLKVLVKIPLGQVALESEQQRKDFGVTLKFWLDKGAAGFLLDEVELISKKHSNFPEMLQSWRDIVKEASTEEFPRAIVLSAYGDGDEAKLDETHCSNGTLIVNYGLTELKKNFSPADFHARFEHTLAKNGSRCRATLAFSNGDIPSLIVRFTSAERDRIIMFSMVADATPFVYFGEEIGRYDGNLTEGLKRNSGVEPEALNWNAVDLMRGSKENNFFSVFKNAAKLREEQYAVQMGDTQMRVLNGTEVVAMSRIKKGSPGIVVVSNFSKANVTVNLAELGDFMPKTGDPKVVSSNYQLAKGKQNFFELFLKGEETAIYEFAAVFPKS